MRPIWLDQEFDSLTTCIGVYALCDLDGVPIYVGQTVAVKERGIIGRVRRHVTSARSDIIVNQQLDPWEVASVMAWAEPDASKVTELERLVHHHYKTTIVAGLTLPDPSSRSPLPPHVTKRILTLAAEAQRKDKGLRLERQARHIERLLDVMLVRKDTEDQRRSLRAHIERLRRRFEEFAGSTPAVPEQDDASEA